MPRLAFAYAVVLTALLSLLAACGDDDNAATPTPSVTSGSPTRTAQPNSGTATPASEHKTTGPAITSAEETTPVPSEATARATPASAGTPAVQPADEAAFLAQFHGRPITQQQCTYSPATAITDCGNLGIYAVDPPLGGQDISCLALLVDGTGRAIQCHSADPVESRVYAIQ